NSHGHAPPGRAMCRRPGRACHQPTRAVIAFTAFTEPVSNLQQTPLPPLFAPIDFVSVCCHCRGYESNSPFRVTVYPSMCKYSSCLFAGALALSFVTQSVRGADPVKAGTAAD